MYRLNTTIDDTSPLITYQGPWQANGPANSVLPKNYYLNTSTSTWTPSSSASLSFNGTAIYIYGGKRSDYGDFKISLDGEESNKTAYISGTERVGLLFKKEGMKQGWHTVVITNNGNWTSGLDIDQIIWTSNITTSSSSTSVSFAPSASTSQASSSQSSDHNNNTDPPATLYDAEQPNFSWLPLGAWSKDENSGGKKTSADGAQMEFHFQGQAISIEGRVGPDCIDAYNVSLDNSTYRYFNASNRISELTTLYYADNLGPGNHTVKILSLNGSLRTRINDGDVPQTRAQQLRPRSHFPRSSRTTTFRPRQGTPGIQQQPIVFGITQAQVWNGNSDVAVSSTTTTTPAVPTSTGTHSSSPAGNLSTGAIVGIAIGGVVFVGLVTLILLLNRRNKMLSARLQRGYMVQAQSEPHSPTAREEGKFDPAAQTPLIPSSIESSPEPGPTLFRFAFRKKRPTVDPFPLTTNNANESVTALVDPFPLTANNANESVTALGGSSSTSIDQPDNSENHSSGHRKNRSGSGLYKPYTNFGKSKHRGQGSTSQGQTNVPAVDGYNNSSGRRRPRLSLSLSLSDQDAVADSDPGEVTATAATAGRSTPRRGDTAFTASTLVAENGSEDMASQDKPVKARIAHNPPSTLTSSAENSDSELLPTPTSRRSAKTRSTTTPRTPKSTSVLSGNSHVRFSMTSHSSRFTRSHPSRRATRSSSPSRTRLLHRDSEVHSDFEEDYDDTAHFYASDARGVLRGSPGSPGASFYNPHSPARTQSSARTPDRTQMADEWQIENEDAAPRIPSLPQMPSWSISSTLNRVGSRHFTASPASFVTLSGARNSTIGGAVVRHPNPGSDPDSSRQTTNDSLPPPAYTSRTPTVDFPPLPPPSPPS